MLWACIESSKRSIYAKLAKCVSERLCKQACQMVLGGGCGWASATRFARDLDDCARNMKLSKIHELHLHFACQAPFVANVTIEPTGCPSRSHSHSHSCSRSHSSSRSHSHNHIWNLNVSYFTFKTRQFSLSLYLCRWPISSAAAAEALTVRVESSEVELGASIITALIHLPFQWQLPNWLSHKAVAGPYQSNDEWVCNGNRAKHKVASDE